MKKILFNLKSIRTNPEGGRTSTFISMGNTITFECTNDKLPDFFIDGKNIFVEYTQSMMSWEQIKRNVKYSGIIYDPYVLEKCIEEKPLGLSITVSRNIGELHHLPAPHHYGKYMNVKLKCKFCKATIMSADLKEEDNDDDDAYAYSEKVCPKCGEWECVDIEYENINDALRRRDKIKR
jgi:hypothetical protein